MRSFGNSPANSQCVSILNMDEGNIKKSINHDVKTSFLIANSFNALIGGLFPLSVGAATVLMEGLIPPVLFCLMFGVPMAGFVLLGFYAAFHENKKMLNIYSVLMGLVVALETLSVVADVFPVNAEDWIMLFLILHIGVTLAAMVLGMYLAKQTPSIETSKSSSLGLGHCLKYVGYGVLVVLIVGFMAEYFGISIAPTHD